MPRIDIAFPLWIAIESHRLKKSVSRTSPVMAVMRLLNSAVKLFACSTHDPNVSKASGMKRCVRREPRTLSSSRSRPSMPPPRRWLPLPEHEIMPAYPGPSHPMPDNALGPTAALRPRLAEGLWRGSGRFKTLYLKFIFN